MNIALTTKNHNAKKRKASFMTLLSEVKESHKKTPPPLYTPPSFPPAVNHPPHAKMKHTGEADALIPELAARWRAKRKHLNKLYSTTYEKRNEGRGRPTRLRPKETPQHISTQNNSKHLINSLLFE